MVFRYCTSRWMVACVLVGIVALGLTGGCHNPDRYKRKADKEVYGILTNKWQDEFGEQVNYQVSDQAPNDVNIAQLIPPSGVINLAQAVHIATQISRDYQSQKESLYLAALDLTGTRHQYQMQWFGTFDAFYAKNNGVEDPTASAEVGVDKTFLLGDGILISTGLAVDWLRYLSGDPDTSLGSVLTASINAPLLGAGAGKAARENLTQAERNVLYRIRTFNRFRKTFVVSIINSYYSVLQRRDTVMVREDSYRRQVDTTKQLIMEADVGKLAQSAADEARQDLLSAENSLVSARQSYQQALDNFKLELSLPTDVQISLDQSELPALEAAGVYQPPVTEEEAAQIALDRRLDLANTRDGVDDVERKLILAAEGLGVQLNLVGSANVDSTPETAFTRLRFHEGGYSLGVVGDLPFDRLAERNAYREALITVQQRQRAYDEDVDSIKLTIRQAFRDLAETAETYRIQKIGLDLAQNRVLEQKIRLKNGRGVIRDLQNSEASLVQAQILVTNALISHTIAKLNFFRDIGLLQVRPDGMWEQVDYGTSDRQANTQSIGSELPG
ncbi:TolC family protein [Planctomycetota bacterium]